MARYRKVSVEIHNDRKFRELSDHEQLFFFKLLTHPHMTPVGAMRATIGGLASEFRWPQERVSDTLSKLFEKGIVRVDSTACFIALTNFVKHNLPENPNVVRGWAKIADLIPDCDEKILCFQRAERVCQTLPKGFAEGFAESFPNGWRLPEPEPEPDKGREKREGGGPGEPNPERLQDMLVFFGQGAPAERITATEIVERERAVFAPVDDLMGKAVFAPVEKRVIDLIYRNGTEPPPAGLQPEVGKKRARQIPEDFKVTVVMREWAASQDLHVDLDLETARMIDHFKANGEPKADWIATWRNWIRRAPQFNGNGNGNGRKDQTKAPAIEHPDHEAHPTHFCSDCNEAHAWTCENFGQPVRCGSPTHSACPKFAARFRR